MATHTSVMISPTKPARMLARIESSPRVGETLRSSSMLTGVCSGFSRTLASPRFFLSKSSGDLRVATINCILYHRRRLDDPIKHNRKAVMNMRGSDVAELLGTIRIESQMNDPALLFIGSASARNEITG